MAHRFRMIRDNAGNYHRVCMDCGEIEAAPAPKADDRQARWNYTQAEATAEAQRRLA